MVFNYDGKYCPQCGTKNNKESIYCKNCGTELVLKTITNKIQAQGDDPDVDNNKPLISDNQISGLSDHKENVAAGVQNQGKSINPTKQNKNWFQNNLKKILLYGSISVIVVTIAIVAILVPKRDNPYANDEKLVESSESIIDSSNQQSALNPVNSEKIESDTGIFDGNDKESDHLKSSLDPNKYLGLWIPVGNTIESLRNQGGMTLYIDSINEDTVVFWLDNYNARDDLYAEIYVECNLKGTSGTFEYYDDGYGNSGQGQIIFNDSYNNIYLSVTSDINNDSKWYLVEGSFSNYFYMLDMTDYEYETDYNDDYIFNNEILPDSDIYYYSYQEVIERIDLWTQYGYTDKEALRLARNEIYARHGDIFDDEKLNIYFYQDRVHIYGYSYQYSDAVSSELNSAERNNIALIKEIEANYK